jgi:AraC family transcriptional regulator, regulatory protein of adaptative response / methylphosphotriester-DNA alkyltransferase methyltransferase
MARRSTERRRRALLAEAEQTIKERYGEFDLGLADIAEEVGCSTRQLQRVFREVGGTSFRTLLLRVRMEQACRLLISRTKDAPSIRNVARQVGYREASGLRQAFLRFYGYNPSMLQPNTHDAEYDRAWRRAEARNRI